MRKAVILLILALLIFQPVLTFAQTNYRYTGQELDPSTGIYDYGARTYQPETGRFMQPDPVSKNLADPQALNEMTGQNLQNLLENPQALNEYSYTQNNPVRYIDPEGEFNFETNQVEAGDTLSGVFGNNWVDVAKHNNLENPNLIYVDQHLNIPDFAQKIFWQNLADIATAFLPGFSDIRDGIENITKKDLITGRSLTPGEEALTFGGFATPLALSAKNLRGLKEVDKLLKNNLGELSDWIRFGKTLIPPDVSGLDEGVRVWAIKGGGVNTDTGFKLPFHYHIHKYNWYKPASWFKYTPFK